LEVKKIMLKTLFAIATRGGIAIAIVGSLNACGSTVPSQPTTVSSTPVLRTQASTAEVTQLQDAREAVTDDVSARGRPINHDKNKPWCNLLIENYDELTSNSNRDHDRLIMIEQEFLQDSIGDVQLFNTVMYFWNRDCEPNYGPISNIPIP
jgi:hypothetical protein